MSHLRAGQESAQMARKKGAGTQIVGGSTAIVPIYSAFADIYDAVMDHVPVDRWARYLAGVAGKRRHLIDVACGTGAVLEAVLRCTDARATGVDSSEPMLAVARKRLGKRAAILSGSLTRVPADDMAADWVICTHDSINYLTSPVAVLAHLREVFRILEPGGIYSFDAVTERNMVREFDGQVREEMIEGVLLRWSNRYERDRQVLVSQLVFQDGKSVRMEVHEQKYYSKQDLLALTTRAGFEAEVEGDYESRSPRATDAFLNFNCRKPL